MDDGGAAADLAVEHNAHVRLQNVLAGSEGWTARFWAFFTQRSCVVALIAASFVAVYFLLALRNQPV
ncbi:uncharacterized protein AMSG_09443 [Thecamonas trahens ATCC 50062]|uniref:Uncharacterized protein n=1 Tax=Thecamonas trahens ATCC 50062 TaxID=461836 RepID=A0A0L0DNY8_THETB|nr:hypothetical protein AMSG_09443 [Thecamonas trahens ATCC 50062]KNC53731.1 hypothetical protein AMSG_09443 [Thecamonas trahens ATCC 50062]|eukprot:XP_013754295.1 hypothetical protein AMSG_09443 [Thecamonas trahens ATCC 50062]